MDLQQLANELSDLGDGYLFISGPPDLDITSRDPIEIKVSSETKEVVFTVSPLTCHLAFRYLVIGAFKPGRMIICWDMKSLFSYHLFHTGRQFKTWKKPLVSKIGGGAVMEEPIFFDLKIIENFIGRHNMQLPKTWAEAANRLKKSYGEMKGSNSLYREVHYPLMKRVIPHLEAVGIVLKYKKLYAHYEIEGQINGRLKCDNKFTNGYVPHVIKPEDRPHYRPPECDDIFLYLDYGSYEVRVLQWLSGDEALGEIVESGDEIYEGILRKMTGKAPQNAKAFGKKLFLPVVFGAGAKAISESLKVSEEIAAKLINILTKTFPKAMAYPNEMQHSIKDDGLLKDKFGRRRVFDLDRKYLARNFCVQSPAATIGLAKLIDLYNALKKANMGTLGFYIHDGYGIFCDKSNSDEVLKVAKDALESENLLFPGLNLKVNCYTGPNLDELEISNVV